MPSEDLSRYREAFLVEAGEHVSAMNAALLRLEAAPADAEPSFELLRAAHTLKSMAAAMSYPGMAELCHAMEDLLLAIRDGSVPVGSSVEALFEAVDQLEASLRAVAHGEAEPDSSTLGERLRRLAGAKATASGGQPAAEGRPPHAIVLEPIQTVSVSVQKLNVLLNLAEELLVGRMRLGRIRDSLAIPELSAAVESLGRLITDLQYHVMEARMVPMEFVFGRFRRMVRDLARQENKEIELVMDGGDIELDRAMVDEVGECLVHLLRNAVDHGIEAPDVRVRAGKPRAGVIRVAASRSKESALIVVEDDGAGLDLATIRQAAARTGAAPEDATAEQLIQTIFLGISTTERVSALSGRGVGLNIVKKRIERIGGSVAVHSNVGRGTRFVLDVPLTLAVIKALFVAVDGQTFAIPVNNVDRLVTVARADFKSALGREAVVLEGEEVPVARLNVLFGGHDTCLPRQPLVVLRKGQARLGVTVDELVSTEEIVIKPMSRALRHSRFFAGSALIGSGEVALVLDVAHLMRRGGAKASGDEWADEERLEAAAPA